MSSIGMQLLLAQHTTTTFPLGCQYRTSGMEWWIVTPEWNTGMA